MNKSKNVSNHPNHIANAKRSGELVKKKWDVIKQEYRNHNPSFCKQCRGILPFKKRHNKFCGHSCSATYVNKRRDVKERHFSEAGKQRISKNNNRMYIERRNEYLKAPNTCNICTTNLSYDNRNRKTCSDECLSELYSKRAIKNKKFGGNRNNKAYGWYITVDGDKVWLESSYEYKVAKDLDTHNIRWIRPNPLSYKINGKSKRYYPDFYLIDYDVYLDPKNDFLIPRDRKKINIVENTHNVRVLILDKDNLQWENISNKLG